MFNPRAQNLAAPFGSRAAEEQFLEQILINNYRIPDPKFLKSLPLQEQHAFLQTLRFYLMLGNWPLLPPSIQALQF